MQRFTSHLVRLSPNQYLPQPGFRPEKGFAWSVSLNLALWLDVCSTQSQALHLEILYQDDRGQHQLPVDCQIQIEDGEYVFSNLVKVPIKGPIKEVELRLAYSNACTTVVVREVFIKVLESPARGGQVQKSA